MSKETVLGTFLNATGHMMYAGDNVPDETAANLKKYRDRGLIGEAESPAKPAKKAAGKKSD